MKDKKYLGDGVYICKNDWNQLEITTEDETGITNILYFEPEVLANFLEYLKRNDLLKV